MISIPATPFLFNIEFMDLWFRYNHVSENPRDSLVHFFKSQYNAIYEQTNHAYNDPKYDGG